MRKACLTSILAAAGASAALALAPTAAADDTPSCTDVSGSTECSTPGNVQINASSPVDTDFTLPYWDDVFGGAYTGGPYAVPYDEGNGIGGPR
ncbi:MAG: hypothetical protein JO152_13710 [Mycobacteriaceae bacterium]|nr:hypothetical protein [Mycobacteriaceae bacterium]